MALYVSPADSMNLESHPGGSGSGHSQGEDEEAILAGGGLQRAPKRPGNSARCLCRGEPWTTKSEKRDMGEVKIERGGWKWWEGKERSNSV